MNPLLRLQEMGQSIWYDNIRRGLLVSGELKKLIDAGEIRGLTSNPSIFEKAIAGSDDYDDALHALVDARRDAQEIFDALAIADIRTTADLLRPVYEQSNAGDGYVSIEVSPLLAHDTATTVSEALRLWRAVDRPNLMVKIPATQAGLPAITEAIAAGLNINITLIFSLTRYAEVIEAYLAGLERRLAQARPIDRIASVASFFVSRVDTLVDARLEAIVRQEGPEAERAQPLLGKAAIANAKMAYAQFKEAFGSSRFAALRWKGARVQRPLWASTSTKNPAYPDVYYVEALLGPDTVNTVPPATLNAYRDHGQPGLTLEIGLDEARAQLAELEMLGIHMDAVTQQLEDEGVAAFSKSFETLIAAIEEKRQALLAGHAQGARASLPPELQGRLSARLRLLDDEKLAARLWSKDPTLWTDDAAHHAEIRQRLGWLTVPDLMESRIPEMASLADEARAAGFTHAALLGMGGSSLCPEVLRESFGAAPGYLDLAVLDSTDPAQVRAVAERSDPARTLYIVASKSGSTTEPNMFFAYFWDRVQAVKGERAGENFVAITDPGTQMEQTARAHGFRRVFLNPPDIGGRYSALSFFGLAPAALLGLDVRRLLGRARRMAGTAAPGVAAHASGGLWLGAALGEAALAGRDKLTLLCSSELRAFGYWVEQLIAESTGKAGKGIVPVEGEPLGAPAVYGSDRLFVHLRLTAELDEPAQALAAAGQPVVTLELADLYDLGAEFFRWEVATAVAGAILQINAFDQPNVQESKDNTVRLLAEYRAQGRLPLPEPAWQGDGAVLYAAEAPAQLSAAGSLAAALRAHLRRAGPGDYLAFTAYLPRTSETEAHLQAMRAAARERLQVATTVGFGPRFLHSTGQLHKGGANNGVFVQITASHPEDLPIPGEPFTFGVLQDAQALGDLQSLQARGRRAISVRLPEPGALGEFARAFADALAPESATRAPARKKASSARKKAAPGKKRAAPARKATRKKPAAGRKKPSPGSPAKKKSAGKKAAPAGKKRASPKKPARRKPAAKKPAARKPPSARKRPAAAKKRR